MSRRNLCLIRCSMAVVFLMLAFGAANAQVLYGSLTGNVTDPSGAAIPGANVEARNMDTGVTRTTPTDVRGVYLFSDPRWAAIKSQ